MPDHLREVLSKGKGELIKGEDLLPTALKTLEKVRDCKELIAVGDVVCSTIVEAGKVPEVCVIDGKSRRTPIKGLRYGIKELSSIYSKVLRANNPASHITEESLKALRNSLRMMREGIKSLIIVDGEEDLLTLPLAADAPTSSCIIYGSPGKGISVIQVNEGIKKEAQNILRKFIEIKPF